MRLWVSPIIQSLRVFTKHTPQKASGWGPRLVGLLVDDGLGEDRVHHQVIEVYHRVFGEGRLETFGGVIVHKDLRPRPCFAEVFQREPIRRPFLHPLHLQRDPGCPSLSTTTYNPHRTFSKKKATPPLPGTLASTLSLKIAEKPYIIGSLGPRSLKIGVL